MAPRRETLGRGRGGTVDGRDLESISLAGECGFESRRPHSYSNPDEIWRRRRLLPRRSGGQNRKPSRFMVTGDRRSKRRWRAGSRRNRPESRRAETLRPLAASRGGTAVRAFGYTDCVEWTQCREPGILSIPLDMVSAMGALGRTDFLFATPSFLTGAGRSIDIAAWLEHLSYNISSTPAEADAWATANDWAVVGQDLQRAIHLNRPADAK
jgi:hypothetical protein